MKKIQFDKLSYFQLIRLRKFLKGLIYAFLPFTFFLNTSVIETRFGIALIENGYNHDWVNIIQYSLPILAIYCIVGIYFIYTEFPIKGNGGRSFAELVGGPLDDFKRSSQGSQEEFSRISNFLNYRDAKFSSMTQEQASKYMIRTGWLDGAVSGNRQFSEREMSAIRYIDSSLSTMTNEDAFKMFGNL